MINLLIHGSNKKPLFYTTLKYSEAAKQAYVLKKMLELGGQMGLYIIFHRNWYDRYVFVEHYSNILLSSLIYYSDDELYAVISDLQENA